MDIKEVIGKQLTSLYNVVITTEIFDKVTLFGIGKRITELRAQKIKEDLESADNLLIDTFVNEYKSIQHQQLARVILRTQLNYLSMENYSSVSGNNKCLYMGIAANTIKQLLVLDGIVGVQPMQGPVGLIYNMVFKYIKPSEEPIELEDEKLIVKENRGMHLEIISSAIEARSRKMQARFNIEAIQDAKFLHNIDLGKELAIVMGQEIACEIVYEVIYDLVKLAEQNTQTRTLDLSEDNGLRRVTDKISNIGIAINQNSNFIATKTRRGHGNVIITNPMGIPVLQLLSEKTGTKFVTPTKSEGNISAIEHAGDIVRTDGTVLYAVYCSMAPALMNTHPHRTTPPVSDITDIKFLIGYRGNNSTDVGYIYAPYVPVLANMVVDATTFQPCISFSTRYGKWTKWEKKETDLGVEESGYLGDSINYYNMLTIPANYLES